jgi:peptide/nickel transport system substrate-binding protein
VLLTDNGGTFYYSGLDVNAPGFGEPRVRRAFGYALNRPRLVERALYGFGRPASIPWPEQSLAYDATLDSTYTYDPDRARQLLGEAGWDANTPVSLLVPSGLAVAVQMAEIAQADLANVGVQVAIQRLSLAEFVGRVRKAQMGGAWIVNIGFMNLSPGTLFTTALPVRVPNPPNFASAHYQELIAATLGAVDDQQLKQNLNELTQIMLDEAFIVVIAEGSGLPGGPVMTRANVHDVAWDKASSFAYQDIWLD